MVFIAVCGLDFMISKLSAEDSNLYLFMPIQSCNPSIVTHCCHIFTFQLSIHDSTGAVFPIVSFLASVCHVLKSVEFQTSVMSTCDLFFTFKVMGRKL